MRRGYKAFNAVPQLSWGFLKQDHKAAKRTEGAQTTAATGRTKTRGTVLLLLSHFSPTLCDAIDGSPLGSSVPGILQARILEWAAISFSTRGNR